MNTININEFTSFLKRVDRDLISRYEKNCLNDGTTIQSVLDEYQTVKICGFFKVWQTVSISFFVVVLAFHTIDMGQWNVFLALGVAIFYAIFIYLAQKKVKRGEEIIDRCGSILIDFQVSVEALNPSSLVVEKFSKTSIRFILIDLAGNILSMEKKFNCLKSNKERIIESLAYRLRLSESRDALQISLNILSGRFGLDFKKAQLFEEARVWMEPE